MNLNNNPVHYWPFFCEENIWHLCQETFLLPFARKVVFISNRNRCFAMKHQRAVSPDSMISWDYHVVLLYHDIEWKILDLDTSLPCPCPTEQYLSNSFVAEFSTCAPPMFRVVDADHFIRNFSSDRRHMRDKNGTYLKPPPPLPLIKSASGEDFNLWDFVDILKDEHGRIYNLKEMYTTFNP